MIEQHQYGRTSLEGGSLIDNYSTLSGSPGLKITHIQEYFEPLCKFAINIRRDSAYKNELINDRRTLMIVPIPTGELLIGQASMCKSKVSDMEGCFIHNYILSNNEKLRYIKVPEKIFGVTQLDSGYDSLEENKLGILAAMPYEESNPYFRNKEELLIKMGIDGNYYNKLIETIVIAGNYDKRIWIITRGVGKEKELCIRALMYHIYRELPWYICEKIGLITTAKWKVCCPNIHIAFLEEADSYDVKDIGDDYLFDFINDKFFNLENTIDISCYLRFVNENRNNKLIYEKLNSYILEIAKVMGDSARRNIRVYNYISTIMRVYMSNLHNMVYIINKEEREGLLPELVRILCLPIKIDMKKELKTLILSVMTSLEVDLKTGTLLSKEEIESIVELLKNHNQNEECFSTNNIILIDIKNAYQKQEYTYIQSVMECLKEDIKVQQYIVGELYKDNEIRNEMIYVQLKNKFDKCPDISDMLTLVEQVEKVGGLLSEDEYYKNIISSSTTKYIESTNDMYGLFIFVKNYCESKNIPTLTYVLGCVEKAFIEQINFNHINTEEELLNLEFINEYNDERYVAIKQFQELITDIRNMSPDNLNVNEMVQERIKYLYRNFIRQERYYMLVYAFLEKDEAREDGWKINLELAFQYLKDISVEDLLQFIIWLRGQKLYVEFESFDEDVVEFLVNAINKGKGVNYKLIKRYFANNIKIRPLYKKIRGKLIKKHIILCDLRFKIKANT